MNPTPNPRSRSSSRTRIQALTVVHTLHVEYAPHNLHLISGKHHKRSYLITQRGPVRTPAQKGRKSIELATTAPTGSRILGEYRHHDPLVTGYRHVPSRCAISGRMRRYRIEQSLKKSTVAFDRFPRRVPAYTLTVRNLLLDAELRQSTVAQ